MLSEFFKSYNIPSFAGRDGGDQFKGRFVNQASLPTASAGSCNGSTSGQIQAGQLGTLQGGRRRHICRGLRGDKQKFWLPRIYVFRLVVCTEFSQEMRKPIQLSCIQTKKLYKSTIHIFLKS